jgi:uncharacterized membrane-anchored protein
MIAPRRVGSAVLVFAAFVGAGPSVSAQPKGDPFAQQQNDVIQHWKRIRWQMGPVKAKLGSVAEVEVPAGFKFTDAAGCTEYMHITQNSPNPRDLGLICPAKLDATGPPSPDQWFVVFDWDAIGYVKDDEKLDGEALLASLRTGQDQDNVRRRQAGHPTLEIVGWSKAPFYDQQTNLLTWATRIHASDSPLMTVNYESRLLGRGGVMGAQLVIDEALLDKELDSYRTLLRGFSFLPGQRHAEFREGDKLAGLGLTALIAGGAAGVAAKTGLLTKLAKPIIAGIVFIGAAIAGLFRKIFGRRESA